MIKRGKYEHVDKEVKETNNETCRYTVKQAHKALEKK